MGFLSTSDDTVYLLGASTWPGEEAILLQAAQRLTRQGRDVRVILVPRHAERGAEIGALVSRYAMSYSQRSNVSQRGSDCVVHIADTTGELQQLCQCAHLALIGKSFAPHRGGQTPIECAAVGTPMVYGPHMSNFIEECRMLEQEKIASRCDHVAEAVHAMVDLVNHPDQLLSRKMRLQHWFDHQTGALGCLMRAFADAELVS